MKTNSMEISVNKLKYLDNIKKLKARIRIETENIDLPCDLSDDLVNCVQNRFG